MERDVNLRYSAKKLLSHPWMVEQSKLNDTPLDEERTKDILGNLQRFS